MYICNIYIYVYLYLFINTKQTDIYYVNTSSSSEQPTFFMFGLFLIKSYIIATVTGDRFGVPYNSFTQYLIWL